MIRPKQKLYCYVDETGQDTAGRFFAVSMLVTEAEWDELLAGLEAIEQQSGKGSIKWHKSPHKHRAAYIEGIAQLKELHHRLFVSIYRDGKDYLAYTADAIAKALRRKRGYRAIVYVDALRDADQLKLKKQLRPSVKIPTQVRGVRREENNAFIRLVDAVCGLARDADEASGWAREMVHRLKRNGVLESL